MTSLPKRRKIDANSTPTAPLPMIDDRLGDLLQADRLVARDDALAIELDAGHAARLRAGGDDDLLACAVSVCLSPSVISTCPCRRAGPIP